MKKIITLLFCFLFLINISITVYASETSIEEIFPYEAGQMLIDNGFESLDYESILNLDASKVIDYLLNILKSELDTPFVVLYLFFLVIIVVSIISGINGGFLNRELERNISTVGILTVCTTALVPVISCAEGARQFISNISSFNNVFVPALSTVMVMSGQIKTGAGYQAVMLFANEFVSIFITNVVMPLLFFYFAFAIIGKTAFEFNTESISSTIKSSINICLTVSMTIFVSLITLKGIIGAGVDSITLKTGRIFIGTFVPAVGGALSEAAGTIQTSLSLIKNTTGIFGIIAVFMYFVPPLIKVFIFKLTCMIASMIGDVLGTSRISGLLKDISGVLSILMSIMLSLGAIFILSTAITLVISKGG